MHFSIEHNNNKTNNNNDDDENDKDNDDLEIDVESLPNEIPRDQQAPRDVLPKFNPASRMMPIDFSLPITTTYLNHMRACGRLQEDAYNEKEVCLS